LLNVQPEEVPGSSLEHTLASVAHWGLYGLLVMMPLTDTRHRGPHEFRAIQRNRLQRNPVFGWISSTWGLSFEAFEVPIDAVHHFLGKWVAWVVVGLHIAAALFHHWVRRDDVLTRMLP
jgi:cytochrome b561